MFFTKFFAPIALAAVVSAANWESVCVQGKEAIMLSNNQYQNRVCLTIPLSSATDKWGGGRTNCNKGTWELYWNVSSTGQAWLCYGNQSDCPYREAFLDERLAKSKGYDKCWSLSV
ncbi:hypothetical protein BGZ97_000875 [Linnemannia gamsii]|jgi:hypothetical protein|uniref:Secreted protein n=1 Tax=Linnemannia gamsii TaxID=64522 RepID=A0A9P6RL89_9FUNG|nr:hypothetical protein BGZ97_000875 [Linnemannia gamsii]